MTNKLGLEDVEQHIPALNINRQQRQYYPVNFRRCAKILSAVIVINLLLLLAILFFFFTRPAEQYYATSFTGKVTPLFGINQAQIALAVTKQHQNDT